MENVSLGACRWGAREAQCACMVCVKPGNLPPPLVMRTSRQADTKAAQNETASAALIKDPRLFIYIMGKLLQAEGSTAGTYSGCCASGEKAAATGVDHRPVFNCRLEGTAVYCSVPRAVQGLALQLSILWGDGENLSM